MEGFENNEENAETSFSEQNDDFYDSPQSSHEMIANADLALTNPDNVKEHFKNLLPYAVQIYDDILKKPCKDQKLQKTTADKVLQVNGIGESSLMAPPPSGAIIAQSSKDTEILVATFGAVQNATIIQIKDMKKDENANQRNVTPEGRERN